MSAVPAESSSLNGAISTLVNASQAAPCDEAGDGADEVGCDGEKEEDEEDDLNGERGRAKPPSQRPSGVAGRTKERSRTSRP